MVHMLNYTVCQLNSPFDDSAFFVRNVYRKQAVLFDCGRLGTLRHSEILSTGDVFISHTHMDHFYGFDRLLRGSLAADHHIRLFGPPGFIGNVDGKFRSYTWNLIDDYKFSMEAVELSPDGRCKKALFKAVDRFVPEISEFTSDGYSYDLGEGFILQYDFFEHRTLSVGYRLSEPVRYSIIKESLDAKGYTQGRWLSLLKQYIAAGETDRMLEVPTATGTITLCVAELYDTIVDRQEPQSLTYITDISPTVDNIEKAVKFADNSSLLIIEAVFTEEDKEHAIEKNHLTIALAKDIFNRSHSDYVRFTHFAARYEQDKSSFMSQLYDGLSGKIYMVR